MANKTEQVITLLTPREREGFGRLVLQEQTTASEFLRELVRDKLRVEGLLAPTLAPDDDPTVVRDDDGFRYDHLLGEEGA